MNIINKLISRIFNSGKMNGKTIPLVVIIGCTGCGKSRLAIEIANKFNGEIISADSMQVYKGLDIITNKVSHEERQQVKHHMIDFLDPLSRFTVIDFRNKVLELIEKLKSNNKLPIIVGGTNYYIESILWNVLIDSDNESTVNANQQLVFDRDNELIKNFDASIDTVELTKDSIFSIPLTYDILKSVSSDHLYNILKEIDPKYADSVHINNKRKIVRCLQVCQMHKKLYSKLLDEQRSMDGGSYLGGPLRFKNSVMLWLQCNETELDDRLDKRVDDMMERGLIDELLNFHQNYNKYRLTHNLEADYTKGLFQTIGFKEFHEYLIMSDEQRTNLKSNAMLIKGTNAMKYVTRRYARKQLKWIRNRFLRLSDREVPQIYGVNCTDLDQWATNVREPAFSIVNSYLNNLPLEPNLTPLPQLKLPFDDRRQYFCDVCGKSILGNISWDAHRKSKAHKYNYKRTQQEYRKLIGLLECHQSNLEN